MESIFHAVASTFNRSTFFGSEVFLVLSGEKNMSERRRLMKKQIFDVIFWKSIHRKEGDKKTKIDK
jgi:hypothetical protein